jgi:hypothetical protein
VEDVIATYFGAWNEHDPSERGRMLERSLAEEFELVDPTGTCIGTSELSDRIARYQSAAPGTKVVAASGIDAHNDVIRYAWKIIGPGGDQVMEGLDVAERADDGRLKRILMFHGPLPPGGDTA